MDYRKFSFTNKDCTIRHIKATFTRPVGTRHWKTIPDTKEDLGFVSLEEYNNYVRSIPFFNNFGGKAYCRAKWEYTKSGYVPTEIVSVSPDGCIKYVDYFDIE